MCAASVEKQNTKINYQPQGRKDLLATVKKSKTDDSSVSPSIHSDEGLTVETSVFEFFTVANLPYRPCG